MRRKRLYEEADEELREEMPSIMRRDRFPRATLGSERNDFVDRLREQIETRGVVYGVKTYG